MGSKPTYEDLAKRIDELERQCLELTRQNDFWHRIEVAALALWEWESQAGSVHLSTAAWAILGYQPGEIPADRSAWESLVHPDDRGRAIAAIREVRHGAGRHVHIDLRAKDKAGAWKWVGLNGNVVERDHAGLPIRIAGALQDNSKGKEIEYELRLFQSVIDRASFSCFWMDSNGRFTYVNDRACQSLGYSRDELLNMGVTDIDAPYISKVWRAFWERLLRDRAVTFETVHRRKDRSDFPVEITANYVKFGEHELSCAYVNDLSEQKRAESALRQNEERLRQAIRVSEIGIFDHDHRSGAVYWSRRQREIHGWGRDEPISLQAFMNLVHPDDSESIGAEVRRAHDPSSDGVWDVDHRIVRRDGSVRWLTARSQTFFEGEGPNRHPFRTVGAVRDVTQEKLAEFEQGKLQAQLIQAQKMESVGRLAGGVAHDFNNMLSVILGRASLVLDAMDPGAPFRADLEDIESAASRSADLTRQLLAFARKQTIAPQVLNMNDIVDGMLSMLLRLIGEDIRLNWVKCPNLWNIKIDPVQVDQILANLLVNARDAIRDAGSITIETHNAEFDAAYCATNPGAVPGQFVLLAVSDDGRGMDEETLRTVFEPFFTTKAQGKGTGLGLATVYGIVKQNEGFVSVYSEPEKGTTFKIYVPRHASTPIAIPDARNDMPPVGGTETILLVEDNLMVLELNETLLKTLGYTVLPASSPADAIRIADEYGGTIHLLLTDIVMPGMNGRDLAKRLTGKLPGLQCLFTSGYTANVIAHRGVLEDGVHFVQKPVAIRTLAAKIREVLAGAEL